MILGENIGSVYSAGKEIQRVFSKGKLVWGKPIDYIIRPFTVKATRDGVSVALRNLNDAVIKYSINGGEWKEAVGNVSIDGLTIAELNKNDTVSITTTDTINCFIYGNTADVYGNIMSLMYGDDFIDKTVWIKANTSYINDSGIGFFGGSADGSSVGSSIVNAENLILPATSLTTGCYASMFANCQGLKKAPKLPATSLTTGCYAYMFARCNKLNTHPELPATSLASYCYYNMFSRSGVLSAPELPATTLAPNCYAGMYRASMLNVAPKLPATTLADGCYYYMFLACENLFTAPELPATTLAPNCYKEMFSSCSRLTTAPELPATTMVEGCYDRMFQYCYMLDYVICYATSYSAETYMSECVESMLYYAAHGTENHGGTFRCKKINGKNLWEMYLPDIWWCSYMD